MKDHPDQELPQHIQLRKNIPIERISKQAAAILKCESSALNRLKYIGTELKENRDMLIFYLRLKEGLNNQTVGDVFGLSYSTISRIVTIFQIKIDLDRILSSLYKTLISNYKV